MLDHSLYGSKYMIAKIAAAAVPAFLAAIISLHLVLPQILPEDLVFEPPLLLPILNLIFITFSSFIVSYIAANSYLKTGSLNILFLGCGILFFGIAGLASGWFIRTATGINLTVTIYNLGILLSSIFHFAGVIYVSQKIPPQVTSNRKRNVFLAYGGVLVTIILLMIFTIFQWLPVFFIQGEGPTSIRQAVLASSFILLLVSALLSSRIYVKSGAVFLYWYSLALAMIALGIVGILLGRVFGGPIIWVGRLGQYIGGIYFVVAIFTAIKSARSLNIPLERAMAAFFREPEELYRSLVETVPDAIVACNATGQVLLWNSAAETMFGYNRNEAIGKQFTELIIPPREVTGFTDKFRQLLTTGDRSLTDEPTEIEAKKKNGDLLPISISLSIRRSQENWLVTTIIRDITEKKKAEEQIRKLYRAVEQSPSSVMITNTHGTIEYANPKYLQLSGYSMDEIIGQNPKILSSGKNPNELYRSLWKTITAGKVWQGEFLNRKKNGELYWEFSAIAPVKDADGNITHYVEVKEDVTERKLAEQEREELLKRVEDESKRASELAHALQKERDTLQIIMENTRTHLAYLDRDFTFIRVNSAYAKGSGHKKEDLIGQNHFSLFPYKENQKIFEKVRDTGQTIEFHAKPFEYKDQPHRGITYWDWTLVPIKDDHNHVVGLVFSLSDVTENVRAAHERERLFKQVQDEHQQLQAVLDILPVGVYIANTNGKIIEVNAFGKKLWEGQRKFPEKLENYRQPYKAWWSKTGEPLESSDWGMVRALTKGEVCIAEELDIETFHGKRKTILNYALPIRNLSGEITGGVAVNVDITDRKEMEQALIKAKDELELRVQERTLELMQANQSLQEEISERRDAENKLKIYAEKLEWSNRELQDFAYVASHDLQEPLRKIQVFGDRIKMKSRDKLDEQGKDYLERTLNAARRMQNLINDLLTYSRITTRGQPFTQTNLNDVLREVISNLEVRIEQTNGRVEKEELPTIDADPSQMVQLFQNIVGNALKFHQLNKSPHVKITSCLMDHSKQMKQHSNFKPQYCQISIQDNGIGFDEKYAEKIFSPFQSLHPKHKYQGTGIGLAICRKIVDRHSGDIMVISKPEAGTVMMIILPLKQQNQGEINNDSE